MPKDFSGRLALFFLPLILLALESGAAVALPHPWANLHRSITVAIVFLCAFFLFGHNRLRNALVPEARFSAGFAAFHGAALVLGIVAEIFLLHPTDFGAAAVHAAIFFWWAVIVVLLLSAIAMVLPPRAALRQFIALRVPLACAFLAALLVVRAGDLLHLAWAVSSSRFGQLMEAGTFRGVEALLGLFYSGVVADPQSFGLGTSRFQVTIAGPCSGVEGLALIFVLTVGWLIVMRRELRLWRAIWLVPLALAAIWCVNLVRIALLIAIGDSGHPAVAIGGFHSQAGWIGFNLVGLTFLFAAQHVPWLRKHREAPSQTATAPVNIAAVYLLPFLAIVATSLITNATTGSFEWFYPLRFFAALALLWFFRAEYKRMDWRFGWLGPLAGAGVFAVWVALAHLPFLRHAAPSTLPTSLAALSRTSRLAWLSIRILAAVVTVPIAEELAFRGYVARRLMSANVEEIPFRCLSLFSILVSAAIFGLMHGHLWLAGIFSGIVFALVAKKRNRLGEAVAAHAVANLLLAVWVLSFGDYALW